MKLVGFAVVAMSPPATGPRMAAVCQEDEFQAIAALVEMLLPLVGVVWWGGEPGG